MAPKAKNWNTTFEVEPANSDLVGAGNEAIQELKTAVQERLVQEHSMNLADAAPQARHGFHKAGSAVSYVSASAPTLLPDGVTALGANDAGRLWFNTTDNSMWEWSGSTWQLVKAVTNSITDLNVTTGKLAAQAVTNPKLQNKTSSIASTSALTGSGIVLGRATNGLGDMEDLVLDADGAMLSDSAHRIPTQKAVREYVKSINDGGSFPGDVTVNGALTVIGKMTVPIGFTYFQLPGKSLPSDLFLGTWTNISSTFSGAFFRAEGGNASAFAGGLQASQNLSHGHTSGNENTDHTHTITGSVGDDTPDHTHGILAASGNGVNQGYLRPGDASTGFWTASAGASVRHTHPVGTLVNGGISAVHQHTINADGGTEARPINYTIRIWERTA
jgi:hypothetical protein